MYKSVGALFDNVEDARNAVNDLIQNNFSADGISLVMRHASDSSTLDVYSGNDARTVETDVVNAGEGAGFGALVGLVTGVLAGIAAITIPGVGPIVVLGPLAGAITGGAVGAATGAAAGGIIAAMVKTGYSEADAERYLEGLRRGSVFVNVDTTDLDVEQALQIMRNNHAMDIAQRSLDLETTGRKAFDPKASQLVPTYSADDTARHKVVK